MRDTVNNEIIRFLETNGCGTFGIDLFFGRVPEKNAKGEPTPTDCWWVIPMSTSVSRHNVTGEDTLRFPYTVFYRSRQIKKLDRELANLTIAILDSHCHNLNGYKTMDIELVATNQNYGEDQEERAYASLGFTATLYDITSSAS